MSPAWVLIAFLGFGHSIEVHKFHSLETCLEVGRSALPPEVPVACYNPVTKQAVHGAHGQWETD